MRLPVIQGVIDRRLLVNFRIDPERLERFLPAPFRPQLVDGMGIGGVCLIRLTELRPRLTPRPFGVSSENAAHRIAVVWDDAGEARCGVFIPRRDTSSRLNAAVGGSVFPGVHHVANFDVTETETRYRVELRSQDDTTHMLVDGHVSDRLPEGSVFESVEAASSFFEGGSLGYSPSRRDGHYDGLELRTFDWSVDAFEIDELQSSFFDDTSRFPEGTVRFDCALLMRGIAHEWHAKPDITSSGE